MVDPRTPDGPTTPVAAAVRAGPLLCGQHVGGYELMERIGRGGLGDVYRRAPWPARGRSWP